MSEQRWGFEELDEAEYEALDARRSSRQGSEREGEEAFSGQDPDQVVEVAVSDNAEIAAVRLSPRWRRSIDPRVLHTAVMTAANEATMQAMVQQVENIDITGQVDSGQQPGGSDESPLTNRDFQRLLDSAVSELAGFTQRLSEIVDRSVQEQSAGRHVRGEAQRGQVLNLEIDPDWAARARHTEIQSELLEVLTRLRSSSTPDQTDMQPSGRAISELTDLASDPQRLMRKLGMPDGTNSTDQ